MTEREEIDYSRSTVFVYEWANSSKRDRNANIFTAKNVETMCRLEHVLLSHKDFLDHCSLRYRADNGTDKADGCRAQSMTPAGSIYTALTGAYSKDCAPLDERDVQTAALCLFYFQFIEDADEKKRAAQVPVWGVGVLFVPRY